jgi:hypothetical protein
MKRLKIYKIHENRLTRRVNESFNPEIDDYFNSQHPSYIDYNGNFDWKGFSQREPQTAMDYLKQLLDIWLQSNTSKQIRDVWDSILFTGLELEDIAFYVERSGVSEEDSYKPSVIFSCINNGYYKPVKSLYNDSEWDEYGKYGESESFMDRYDADYPNGIWVDNIDGEECLFFMGQ